jgi:hypothetical protein
LAKGKGRIQPHDERRKDTMKTEEKAVINHRDAEDTERKPTPRKTEERALVFSVFVFSLCSLRLCG